ncbi:MAG: protein kinase [Butyricicoccaceae bacterium]
MKVTIEFTKGSLSGQSPMVFEGRNVIVVGRDKNCHIRPTEGKVSRNHCVLDMDNKGITVRDFGSLNGTYVNGKNVGQREKGMSVEEGRRMNFASVPLRTGDRVGLSRDFEMRIRVEQNAGKRPVHPNENAKPGPGEVIAGYQEIKLLGKGGMGKVYLVRERESGRQMALKLMLPDCQVDEHSKEMFLREAFVAQQLQHSQVVRTYDSGYSPIGFYILMEYCPSGSVDQLMEKNGPLPWRTAVDITLQVLDGLEYVHTTPVRVKLADGTTKTARGIVHRDLKVQNVFLCDTSTHPRVKVADFGLAKAFETAGLTGSTLNVGGTLAFMPRQQVINYRYCKPEVDVWAAAAMLYYMLTGKPPKPFQPGEQMIKTVLTRSAVPILKRNRNVPKKLAAVIDYALIDDPGIPFQSAAELKRRLKECL